MTRSAAALAALVLLAGTGAPAQEATEKVQRIFDRIEESKGAAVHEGARELEELGRGAIEDLRKGLGRADAFVRIAAAKALYSKELREEGLEALQKVAAGKNAAARRIAIDVASAMVAADAAIARAERQKIAADFEKQVAAAEDGLTQVALWRAVYRLSPGGMKAIRAMKELHSGAEKRDVKEEAALALAEMDRFIDAKATLAELAKEPSERGRMARAYLKVNELSEDLARRAAQSSAAPKYDYRQIDEAIEILKTFYHDESKIVPEKLVEAAVRGACASLDPYTVYMDEAAINQLKNEDLRGEYGGIGARVSMRKDKAGNGWLTIEEPIFSGPAYRNGLRSSDRIIEIEGESTVNRELMELVKRLRGKAGTPVRFKVVRRGWTKEREFSLNRERIHLETTMHRMLPGQIGYIRLTGFGEQDIDLVEKAVKALAGMKCLVFDLRGNTGGYLRTAEKLASYFLDRGQPIVSTRARGEEKEKRFADGSKLTDAPMIMLVDDGSASASEILAGALQDHKRALLVGEKTFGKGSVQDMKYLRTTGEKAAVKVTIAKWFLPSGRSVEKEKPGESGVEPDVKAAPHDRDFWRDAEFERLRAGDEIDKYLKDNENKELFRKIAEADGGETTLYPKFDELYESLKSKCSKDDVRELVREFIRKRVQDEQGKPLYIDFQVDAVLQRGILEACKKAGIDAKTVTEYATFSKTPVEEKTSDAPK